MGPVDNESSLVVVMAWHRTGDKPMPDAMIIQCTDAYTRVHASMVNASPPGQNDRHFPDDRFKYIFMNKKFCILIEISLKFVSKGPIDNNPILV